MCRAFYTLGRSYMFLLLVFCMFLEPCNTLKMDPDVRDASVGPK